MGADLIKGVRSCKSKEQSQYITKAIAEIKDELKSRDMRVKSQALAKLSYVRAGTLRVVLVD